MATTPPRKTWDDKFKSETAERILRADYPQQMYDAVRKELKIQPYQLLAWVGTYAIQNAKTLFQASGVSTSDPLGKDEKSIYQILLREHFKRLEQGL